MPIAYTDTENGKNIVAFPGIKPDGSRYTPEEQACAMNFAPGSWTEITDAEAAALMAPTPEEQLAAVITNFESRIQARLDDFARTLTYDNMLSACTYATSSVDMYRIEGQYCVDARDATWARAYELLEAILPAVQAGGDIPPWGDIEARLPELAWPEGSRGYEG